MVKFTNYFSGSDGNLYFLEINDTKIMLECGVPFSSIIKIIDLSEISGCFLSHSHKDHSYAVKDILRYVKVWTSYETANELNIYDNENVIPLDCSSPFLISNKNDLIIGKLLKSYHNADGSCGIYIKSNEYKIVFMIDTFKIPYMLKDLTHIFIEANWDNNLIDNSIYNRNKYHMEISDTLEFVKSNYSSKLQQVELLHISKKFGNKEDFNLRLNKLLEELKNNEG